jgi:hypothetical protein
MQRNVAALENGSNADRDLGAAIIAFLKADTLATQLVFDAD